jgi:hypothetical protein
VRRARILLAISLDDDSKVFVARDRKLEVPVNDLAVEIQ